MIKHYVKEMDQYLLCDKKGLHSEEPLDLICTSPLCRQNPLACSVCFDEKHKHHRVLSLSKFIDQFSRQTKNFDKKLLYPQIANIHKSAIKVCSQLKQSIASKLDQFQKDINSYADYLYNLIDQRDQIYKLVHLEATPERMCSTINLSQLRKNIKFILNNSKFDNDVDLCKIATPLTQANEKIQALVSKLEYVSFNCMRRVEVELGRMKQLRQTIQNLKGQSISTISNQGTPATVVKLQKNHQSQPTRKDSRTKDVNTAEKMTASNSKHFTTPFKMQDSQDVTPFQHSSHFFQRPKFKFTMKHPELVLHKQILKSNVHGKQGQFALATPSLDQIPTSKWMLKIVSCRDIFCTNSLAIGICHVNQLKKKHFQARVNDFQDCYMLTSSGDVITPQNIENNSSMKFKSGDLLELQYDSHYQLLQIKNENGNILSLKVERKDQDPLFLCVRMTFAGDCVELLNC